MTLDEIRKSLAKAPDGVDEVVVSLGDLEKLLAFVDAYDTYSHAHEGKPPIVMRMGERSFQPQQALIAARAALESDDA